jgi:hypothetical protein
MRRLQERIENDQIGRAVITGLIIFILATLLASNLPDSPFQSWLDQLVSPVRDGVGLDQAWGVFAPDPRSTVYGLEANIRYDDGSTQVWTWHKGDPFISEYRDYHWQKWAEQARLDDQSDLWRPLAVWLARTHDSAHRHPTDITLVRLWTDLNPPGTHPTHGQWNRFVFFTLQVSPSVLALGATR